MAEMFDIIIIGGGPAGISAALTARHRNKSVAVIANPPQTTSLAKAPEIGNYPGVAGTGMEVEKAMLAQLKDSGAVLIEGRAISVMSLGKSFGVAVGNDFYEGLAVIIAAGITRESAYPGENEYLGKGVSYCATCDGMLYRGKTVAVLGNGEEAKADAKFLTSIGCEVLHFDGTKKTEIRGQARADTLIYDGGEYKVACVFILKDTISVGKLVPGLAYGRSGIEVNAEMATNIPGIFAAGDCAGKPYQLAKAVGDGNVAALAASEFVEKNKDKTKEN